MRKLSAKATAKWTGEGVHASSPNSSIPTWVTTFPKLQRLRDNFYGIADSAVDPYSLLQAQHDFPAAKVIKWGALNPKPVLQLRWETSLLWGPDATMSPTYYAGIKYIVQSYLEAGMNVSLGPQDNIRGSNGVYTQLHYNAAGVHYNWQWLVDSWINLVQQLQTDLAASGFGPDRVTLEIVNEMGNGVLGSLWSMSLYNNMWAWVIPRIRAILTDYTFICDLYPYASPNQYSDTAWGGAGVAFELPSNETNLVIAVHPYHPAVFTDQGNWNEEETGMRWIVGMTWGMTKAQAGAVIDAIVDPGGNAARTAQITWWKTHWPDQIEAVGFTKAGIVAAMSGLIAYCRSNQRALVAQQWGCLAYGAPTAMSLASANAYEADMSSVFMDYGLPNSYWIEQLLTDDPTRSNPANVGSESFVPSRVAANTARTPPAPV